VHDRQVVLGSLLVSRSNRAKPLESVEKALDLIAFEIELAVLLGAVPRLPSSSV